MLAHPLGTCPSQIPELWPRIQDMLTDLSLYHMATPVAAGKTSPRMYGLGLGKEECTKENETVARRMRNGYNKKKTPIISHYNSVVSICVWTEYLYSPKIPLKFTH